LNLLEDFLTHYQGCILVVSHDRWFMNKLVDHLFIFEGNGKVKDFYGNYTEYRIEKQKSRRAEEQKSRKANNTLNPYSQKSPLVGENSYALTVLRSYGLNEGRGSLYKNSSERKLTWKEAKELEQLELEIPKMEEEKEALLQKMNSGTGTPQELNDWGNTYQTLSEEIDTKTKRWLELSEKKYLTHS